MTSVVRVDWEDTGLGPIPSILGLFNFNTLNQNRRSFRTDPGAYLCRTDGRLGYVQGEVRCRTSDTGLDK